MGDTLSIKATRIYLRNSNLEMWDKGKMVVIISRTKLAKNKILVGHKNNNIEYLKVLLMKKPN